MQLQGKVLQENKLHVGEYDFDIAILEVCRIIECPQVQKAASNVLNPTDPWYFKDQITMFYGPKGHFVKALLTFHEISFQPITFSARIQKPQCLCTEMNETKVWRRAPFKCTNNLEKQFEYVKF